MADCQVDFYVLQTAELDGRKLACRLALMALEHGHGIQVIAETERGAQQIDDLMWAFPAGRFVPHGLDGTPEGRAAPIRITTADKLEPGDLVINLSEQPVSEPGRFSRLLEIVPHRKAARDASREKFRFYRGRGLSPKTHEISK